MIQNTIKNTINKIGILRFHKKKLKQFDKVTQFRLFMSAIINIQFALITPVLGQLYGYELNIKTLGITAATVLAAFSIIRTIGMKLSPKIMKSTSFSNIFKIHIIVFTIYTFSSLLYFIDVKLMVWSESILSILDLIILNAYSMGLNNFITYFHNNSYTKFTNYRNDIQTESWLFGATLSMIISWFLGIEYSIISFLIIGIIVAYYNFKNWNLMKPYDFRYMLKYLKMLKNN